MTGYLFQRVAILASLAGVVTALPSAAMAAENCVALIDAAEQRHGIPHGLLMAIAITESGINGAPDPLAMNIDGRSYRAADISDMASVISANGAKGVTSIDVGCMQINLKHHGSNFTRPQDLLNSQVNVDYGAKFLLKLATETRSWRDAVMSYHNRSIQSRRKWYGCQVWNTYLRIGQASTGFLQCGPVPGGSSTASTAPVSTSPIVLSGYGDIGGLNTKVAVSQVAPGADEVRFGLKGGRHKAPVQTVSFKTTENVRVQGSLELVSADGAMPSVMTGADPHADAFRSIKLSSSAGGLPAVGGFTRTGPTPRQ